LHLASFLTFEQLVSAKLAVTSAAIAVLVLRRAQSDHKHNSLESLEEELKEAYPSTTGHPDKPIRLMVGLHYLRYMFNLSDERVVWAYLGVCRTHLLQIAISV
jgi:hypothetical protein